MKIRSLLAPTDFSAASRQGARQALEIARRFGAEIHFLHVLEEAPVLSYAQFEGVLHEELLERASQELEAWTRDLGWDESSGPVGHLWVSTGRAQTQIPFVAEEKGCDLLVMSTHGQSGFVTEVLGRVTERVLRTAPCPVMIFQPPQGEEAFEPYAPQRILVPIDLADPDPGILDDSAFLAREYGAEIEVVHVVEPPDLYPAFGWLTLASPTPEQLFHDVEAEVQERLEAIVAESPLAASGASLRVLEGVPHRRILEHARAVKSDLIVLSTHGRKGLGHFFLGSVAERVSRDAPCPVLVPRRRSS